MREQETLKLLTYGYQNFTLISFTNQGEVVAELPVWKGLQDRLPVVAATSSAVVLPREYVNRIHVRKVIPQDVIAPIEPDQVLGKLLVTIGADNVRSIPLVAGVGIGPAGIVKSLRHHLYRNGLGPVRTWIVVMGSMLSVCVAAAVVVMVGKKRRRRFPLHRRLARGGRLTHNRLTHSRLMR